MAQTQVRSNQIGDGEVKRADLNVSTSGSAVIAKAIAGSGISLSSTGPDAGTGDVTISLSGAGPDSSYTEAIGDGSTTAIVVTHNLNSRDLIVVIRETASPYAQVFAGVELTTVNTATITFTTAPATDEYTVSIFATSSGSGSPLTTKGDLWGYDTADARVPVGTDGQVLTADSTDAQGIAWKNAPGDMSFFRNIGSTLDRWYIAGLPPTVNTISTASTAQNSANVLRAIPFVCPKDITLDRIAIQVTGTAAGDTRLGIYRATSTTNLYPDALVLDAGTVSVGSTGLKSITISQALEAGTLYWFVYVSDVAPATRGMASSINVFGADNALGTGMGSALSVAFTYGTLPGTFPGSATILSNTTVAAIGVRLSA